MATKFDNAPHPGEVLLNDYLTPKGISQYRLAKAMGKSEATVSNIINGKSSITPDMAILLGKALDTTPEFWLGLEAAYRLSKCDGSEADGVEQLVSNSGMYRSGGYVYSDLHYSDATLGRAVKAAYIALGHLDGDDQQDLQLSLQHYLTYGTIEFPGVYAYNPDLDHMHREVFAIFEMFLIMAGEDIREVEEVSREQWMEMVENVGKFDEDGNPVDDVE